MGRSPCDLRARAPSAPSWRGRRLAARWQAPCSCRRRTSTPARCSAASRTTSSCWSRSALCLWAGVALARPARAPRLAADRRRRRRLDVRRDLLHRGPVDGGRDPDPVARRRRLPALPAVDARRGSSCCCAAARATCPARSGPTASPPRSRSRAASAALVFETVLDSASGRRSRSRSASPTRSRTWSCSA